MANRPVFVANKEPDQLILEHSVEFKFYTGFALSQKAKSIRSLHEAFARQSDVKVLEVSTKSESKLGWALSAFNLQVQYEGHYISMESAFQGSKVFENGVQHDDLYHVESIRAKKDERLKNSGTIIGFHFQNEFWENKPKTAFYDWLYINALYCNHKGVLEELMRYEAFSDIEFNPKKSVNCQARTCALAVSLNSLGLMDKAMENKDTFLKLAYPSRPKQQAFVW